MFHPAAGSNRPAGGLLPRHGDVVPGGVRGPDRGAERGVGGDRGRRERARHRADRLRQDAGGVPVGPGRPDPGPGPGCPANAGRVLYVSPLKALAVDVERNLRAPWPGSPRRRSGSGRRHPASPSASGPATPPPAERRAIVSRPPDILITTPESLFLMLTSAGPRRSCIGADGDRRRGARAGRHQAGSPSGRVLGAARGADSIAPTGGLGPLQRIGLSATVRPPERVAAFLGGPHPVRVVAPPAEKSWDLSSRGAGRGHERPRRDGVGAGSRPRSLDDERPRSGHRRSGRMWRTKILDLIAAAPLDHRLRQLPPAGGTADRPPQRAARRAAR